MFKVGSKFFNLLTGRETNMVSKEGVILIIFNSFNASLHKKKALDAFKKLKSI